MTATDKKLKLIDSLPQSLKDLVSDLEAEDVQILAKHLPNFNAAKELSNLVEVGADIARRRKEIQERSDTSGYNTKLVSTFSAALGIAESTLFHATKLAEIFGITYLRQIVEDASKQNIKLTFAHLRELNRLDSPDWAENRLVIISKIFDQEYVTSREVQAAVDSLLGVTKTVSYVDPDAEGKTSPAKAKKSGDALDDIASSDDIETLCVQLVELVGQVEKKFDKIGERVKQWREDVSAETLEGMTMDNIDSAVSTLDDFVGLVKDLSLSLNDIISTAIASQVEV